MEMRNTMKQELEEISKLKEGCLKMGNNFLNEIFTYFLVSVNRTG